MNFEIEKTTHTKTGKDLWVVKFERIEDREEYKVFSLLVRKIGGYWSRFTNGFNFSFDPTDVITKEFGDKNFKKSRSTKVSQPNIYAIEKGKIAKNSKHLHYILKNIIEATVYHLGYDEPMVTQGMDNDPVDVSKVVAEIKSKDYDTLWYDGKGHFSLRIHSNYNYKFIVEGVVDLNKLETEGLVAYNYYVPVKKEPNFGNDIYEHTEGNAFYKNDEEPENDYKENDRVLIASYGYAREAEIVEEQKSSYTTSIKEFGESSFNKKETRQLIRYKVKTIDGLIESSVPPERIKPYESGIAVGFDYIEIQKGVTSGVYFQDNQTKQHPFVVWESLIKSPGNIRYYEEKQRRARKKENKEVWRKQLASAKKSLLKLKEAWFNWELSSTINFEFTRIINGESKEEQKERIKTWAENNKWKVNYPVNSKAPLASNNHLIQKKEKESDISVDLDPKREENLTESTYYFEPESVKHFINDHTRNQAIEKLIDKHIGNNLEFNEKEIEFINQYSGSGGLQKQGAKGKGIMTEYFTPDEVVQKMWDLAYIHGYQPGGRILENSVGIGRFLKYAPKNSQIDAFEINRYSYIIAKTLYPAISLRNIPFEASFVNDKNFSIKDKVEPNYDLVIGNPPYGDFNSKYSDTEKKYTKASNLTEYFITRSLDLLKTGALLVYIIGSSIENGGIPFLSSGKTACKEKIIKKAKLVDAYRLGNKIFKHTSVLADIVIFQKK